MIIFLFFFKYKPCRSSDLCSRAQAPNSNQRINNLSVNGDSLLHPGSFQKDKPFFLAITSNSNTKTTVTIQAHIQNVIDFPEIN